MIATEIADGLYQINLLAVHAFFSVDEDEITLIDTGMPNQAGRIDAALRERGYTLDQVHHVILTHIHSDHVGSAKAVIDGSGARVYAHGEDAPAIAAGIRMRPSVPGPGLIPRVMAPLARRTEGSRSDPIAVHQTLADGEELSFGGGFRVIHTPGHTAGHISLMWLRRPVLLVADAAAHVGGLRPPFVLENPDAAYESLRRLAGLNPELSVFGHGAPLAGNGPRGWQRYLPAM